MQTSLTRRAHSSRRWLVGLAAALAFTGCQKQNAPADQAFRQAAPAGDAAQPGAPGQPAAAPAAPSAAPVPQRTEIPAGTIIEVRVDNALSTASNQAGDRFAATLAEPVMVAGQEVLPRGTRFTGHVTTSDSSGRLQGRAVLGITLDSFEAQGQEHRITTSLDTKTSEAHKKRNIELIGGGAGLGALIGGLAGGGRGAAIGALAGGGAGTAGAAATGKREVTIPAETVFSFRLRSRAEL